MEVVEIPRWREIQKKNFTKWEVLSTFLNLSVKKRQIIEKFPVFSLNLPYRLAEKIEKNSLDDPILRQFLPTKREKEKNLGFLLDPVCDRSFRLTEKLIQKYSGRCLLLCSSACAMHCRFCFRQNYPYEHKVSSFEKELEQIEKDQSLFEVILSGGDPLSLSDRRLSNLIDRLDKIAHLKLLRIHTRFPIGIPERITEELENRLRDTRLQVAFVLHINHKKELDEEVIAALQRVRKSGAMLLTQTVLLKGVNDSLASLRDLFLALVNIGILPYYLHHLDPVAGSFPFEVEINKGQALITKLQEELPGYAVPRYVTEIPFKKSKTPL